MQIDESLLQQVCEAPNTAFVRIYQWNEPTITLGHFQKNADIPVGILANLPHVKRLTGGGAILHDKEITYSIALPAGHPFRHSPIDAYEHVHTAIIELLREFGVDSRMRSTCPATNEDQTTATNDDKFLCFLRSDPRDIVSKGQKIVGSAQRRRKGSILQHGSILLSAAQLTPNMLGIVDLWPDFEPKAFSAQVANSIASAITKINVQET